MRANKDRNYRKAKQRAGNFAECQEAGGRKPASHINRKTKSSQVDALSTGIKHQTHEV